MNNLKYYRKKKGFSQRELANKVGISGAFLSLIEQGKNKPSKENLKKIAEVLEVSPEELNFNDKDNESNMLEGKEHLKDELYEWIKSKNLLMVEAISLIDLIKIELIELRNTKLNNMTV